MKTFMGLLVVLMLSATSHALDIKDLTQSPGDKSSVTSADLVASLVEDLGITGTQASGGTSALVAMAANNLSGEDAGLFTAEPTNTVIDARLIGGSAIFGLGWGIAGFCPGAAIPALGSGKVEVMVFVAALLAGIWVAKFIQTKQADRKLTA